MQKENKDTSATIKDKEMKSDKIEKEEERSAEVSSATQDKNVEEDES
jgi:hypothetical protein